MDRIGGEFDTILIAMSSGRTGTKAISSLLNSSFEGVYANHEPNPSWRLRIASNMFLAGRCGQEKMVRLLRSSRRKLLSRVAQPVYVESNGHLGGFLDVLSTVFDHPRILHIVRDPRTYVPSVLNFGSQRGLKRLASDWLPYWILKPEDVEPSHQGKWRNMTEIERFSWYWRISNLHLERGAHIFGKDYRRVRFEDLFAVDGSSVREVAAWLGLRERPRVLDAQIRRKVNASAFHGVPDWGDWLVEEQVLLLKHCEDLLEHFGYSGPAEEKVLITR